MSAKFPRSTSRPTLFGLTTSRWRFEVEVLRGRNLLRRLIVIDTNKDDDGLLRARAAIEVLAKAS